MDNLVMMHIQLDLGEIKLWAKSVYHGQRCPVTHSDKRNSGQITRKYITTSKEAPE